MVTQRAIRNAVSRTRATTHRVPICCLFMLWFGCAIAGGLMERLGHAYRLTPWRYNHVSLQDLINGPPMEAFWPPEGVSQGQFLRPP